MADKLKDGFTTQKKFDEDALKEESERTEQNKTILSNDAYAVCTFAELILDKLEHLRMSWL